MLDTNAVLDWWLFADPAMAALGGAIAAGQLRWIATRPMLEELAAVLQRGAFESWRDRLEHVLTHAHRYVQTCETPVPPLAGHPQCRDPDDQKFIDLALAAPARWLITRDKALLALARAAARRQVTVCTPGGWSAEA